MFKKKKITDFIPFRKGVRKGIAVLTVIVILCSLFTFVSSAVSSDTLDDVFSDVILRDSLGSPIGSGSVRGNSVYIDFDFIQDTVYEVTVELVPSDDLPATLWQSFEAFFYFRDSFYFQTSSGYAESFDVYRGIVGEETYQGDFSYSEWGFLCDFDFPSKKLPSTYSYCFSFAAYCSKSDDMVLNFSNVNLNFLTDDEKATYDTTNRIIENQDKNTDRIISNQDENTDKIIQNEKEMQENEKQEANDTLQSGLDEGVETIPNYQGDLLGAFSNLMKSMIHEEVGGEIPIPAIIIPEIAGYFPEVVLFEGGAFPIDKEVYEIFVPDTLRMLVSSILVIALILFCFKELYGFFEYIMTLRGGSK